jgi:PAT family beta-lactamase induction signal transducer AmpG
VNPIKDFFQRYGASTAVLLLALVGLYRISDIVLGVISNVFYQDLGFTKEQIAGIVKTFGLIMTLVGGFLGGVMTIRFGVIKILFWGALLSAVTNVLFMALAQMGNNELMLYVVISADNLAAGLASAAFVAFLSSLTNVSFTAVQYAIFTSLMTLFPKLLGGYSGTMVEAMGYAKLLCFHCCFRSAHSWFGLAGWPQNGSQ